MSERQQYRPCVSCKWYDGKPREPVCRNPRTKTFNPVEGLAAPTCFSARTWFGACSGGVEWEQRPPSLWWRIRAYLRGDAS